MAMVGVVYSIAQSRVRRIIVPDNDKQLSDPAWLLRGEAMLSYDAKLGFDLEMAQTQVSKATGRAPDDDEYAIVDEAGRVAGLIKHDPTIDIPRSDLVKSYAGVGVGCTYTAASDEFTQPSFEIPAGVDKSTGLPVPEKTEPARVVAKPVE